MSLKSSISPDRAAARAQLENMLAAPAAATADAEITQYLLAANQREIAPEELAGYADALRAAAVPIDWKKITIGETAGLRQSLTDACGTGGDRCHTFNISTAAALLASACGVPVAKHGNRSATSKCGSADVLEHLGIPMRGPETAAHALREDRFAFLFAPAFHPGMARVAKIRRAVGVPTFFNLLGPLANPAGTRRQLIGTYSVAAVRLLARTLALLDAEHALVVHASDGLDEITLTGTTIACEVRSGEVREFILGPEDFGLKPHLARAPYAGGETAAGNADMVRRSLASGGGPCEERSLWRREIVLANAAAVVYVAGFAANLSAAMALASDTLASGRAVAHLRRLQGA